MNRIPGSVRTLRLPGFFRNDLRALRSRVRDILRICRLVEAVHNPLVVVQGDLPRITYLALQWVAPLMFIRQDGILTCPGNDRFLARDRTVCGHRAGLNCL
ncbi:MAG TPA: hypothetical protein VKY92_08775, partial [Verrucomicrobiae bacterium]|nr:hypothetical protein [Verrucomicrobiae bacterium]